MAVTLPDRVRKPKGVGFNGVNFMTPDVIGYYRIPKGWAELSEGTGISRQPIYGVTIKPDGVAESRLFQSRGAALGYIDDLCNGRTES